MKKLCGILLSVYFAWNGLACSAENIPVPFKQIEREAQSPASIAVLNFEVAVSRSYEGFVPPVAASSAVFASPMYKQPRTFDAKYLLVNGLHLGLAALDLGLTQRCIANHHCREGNPLMPSSLGGQLAMDSAFVGSGAFISYRLKKQDSRLWWMSPVVGIGAHTAGAVTGFINR